MNRIAGVLAGTALLLAGCHTITEELPTAPSASPAAKAPASGVLKVSIPTIPTATPTPAATPAPTPAPGPTPAPTPAPTPTPQPPSSGGCGAPLPPPLWNINTKIHIRGPNRYTLDSTPIVHDREYCAQIGFTDGRVDCPVRTEGTPDRVACEEYAIGRASDTGRPGPTWTRNGRHCTGEAGDCENHEENQYLLYAYGSGTYKACSASGVCGTVQVDR